MTDKELLQEALDALTYVGDKDIYSDTIDALRARLAQPEPAECDGGQCGIGGYCKECPKTHPEQEPVAWKMKGVPAFATSRPNDTDSIKWQPLYTAPPQRKWVGLTDKDIEDCLEMSIHGTCRAIEAKLKEKNN